MEEAPAHSRCWVEWELANLGVYAQGRPLAEISIWPSQQTVTKLPEVGAGVLLLES